MREPPEYTHRGIAFGRTYFVAFGVVLLAIGTLGAMFWEAPLNWAGGGALTAAGIVALLYSASNPGKNVAHAARKMVEDIDE